MSNLVLPRHVLPGRWRYTVTRKAVVFTSNSCTQSSHVALSAGGAKGRKSARGEGAHGGEKRLSKREHRRGVKHRALFECLTAHLWLTPPTHTWARAPVLRLVPVPTSPVPSAHLGASLGSCSDVVPARSSAAGGCQAAEMAAAHGPPRLLRLIGIEAPSRDQQDAHKMPWSRAAAELHLFARFAHVNTKYNNVIQYKKRNSLFPVVAFLMGLSVLRCTSSKTQCEACGGCGGASGSGCAARRVGGWGGVGEAREG